MHAQDGVLYIFRQEKGLQRINGPRYLPGKSVKEAIMPLEGVASLDHFILIRDTLVGISNGGIVLFDLGSSAAYLKKTHHLQAFTQVKHIAFDPYLRSLYIADENAGLLKADMTFPSRPAEVAPFMPELFDAFKGRITGLKFFGTHLFAVIRNEGVCAVHCANHEEGAVKMYRSKDPRDVLFIPEEGVLLVADADEGLLTFAEGDELPFQRMTMTEAGLVPLEIVRFSSQVAVVRMNDFLYLYHFIHQHLHRIAYYCKRFTVDTEQGYLYHMYFDELTVRSCFGNPAFFGLPEKGTYDPGDWRVPLYRVEPIHAWKSDDYFDFGDDHD